MAHTYDLMTNEQSGILNGTRNLFRDEAKLCVSRIFSAELAIVPLPWKNEAGTAVIHGCNMEMESIVRYWAGRLRLIEDMVLRATFKDYTGFDCTSDVLAAAKAERAKRYAKVFVRG